MFVLLSRTLRDNEPVFHIDTIEEQPDPIESINRILKANGIVLTTSFDELLDSDDLDVRPKALILKIDDESIITL